MIPQSIYTFFRTLARNKSLAAINLLGLALGFCSCIFIALYVFDELGYDSYQKNLERIYRINTRFVSEGSVDHVAIAASPLPAILMDDYPEVEACVRVDPKGAGVVVRCGAETFREDNAYAADAAVFKVFSWEFFHGNPATALSGANKVVLTRASAMKYFGKIDVVGSMLSIDKLEHQVTAVIEDIPENSELRFSMLMSIPESKTDNDWFDFSYYIFVMFKEESMRKPGLLSSFRKKLEIIADEKINAAIKKENIKMSVTMHLQPLHGLHFDNTLTYDTPKGSKNYVYIFACVGGLILFIACINYINFSIVQSMEKSREIGVRKVVGASLYQLVGRYITQSFLLTLFALFIAVGLVYLLLPFFNEVVGRNFFMSDLVRMDILLAVGIILVITGVLAGSFPAFYGSSVNIVSALKGNISSPAGKAIRKISLSIQFAVSLGLIIATVVIYLQMEFVRNYDLGFHKDNVVALTTPEDSTYYPAIRAFKEDLLSHNDLVRNVSIAGDGGMPGDPDDEQRGTTTFVNGKGEEEVRMTNNTYVDADYFSVLGIKLKKGRSYAKGSVNDQENSIIVNEALVQALGWDDPLVQTIQWGERDRRVIGVVGNIHYKSLYNPVQPQLFVPEQHRIVNVIIALRPDAHREINELRKLWQKHFPEEPFVYRYLDKTLEQQYKEERAVARISAYFSVLTIVISVLGICGLTLLNAYQRRKEIGIRRIVGAGFSDIVKLFFTEYLLLLTLALIVISPVTWYVMERWLTTFINHTPLEFTMFISVGAAFALLTLAAIVASIRKVANVRSAELIRDA